MPISTSTGVKPWPNYVNQLLFSDFGEYVPFSQPNQPQLSLTLLKINIRTVQQNGIDKGTQTAKSIQT